MLFQILLRQAFQFVNGFGIFPLINKFRMPGGDKVLIFGMIKNALCALRTFGGTMLIIEKISFDIKNLKLVSVTTDLDLKLELD